MKLWFRTKLHLNVMWYMKFKKWIKNNKIIPKKDNKKIGIAVTFLM